MAEKPSGYRLEYASSARAKCKGIAWRHWGCTTTKILENMKKSFSSSSELDGYDDLRPEDKAKVDAAWEAGHVADEDIPESAKKPAGQENEDDEEKPKKKAGAKKAKKDEDEDNKGTEKESRNQRVKKSKTVGADDDTDRAQDEEKSKKASVTKKVKVRTKNKDTESVGDGVEVVSKKKADKKPSEPKEKVKRASKKDERDEDDEDPTVAIDAVPPEEDDDVDKNIKPKKVPVKKSVDKKEKVKRESKKLPLKKACHNLQDFDEDQEMADAKDEPEADGEESIKKRKRPMSKASVSKPASKKAKPLSKTKKSKEVVEEDDGEHE
ncbi:hypothetical protein C0993_006197 [Termitomyces sp. T159_Od127]|nr:hypothetical protein C0993_006197 [Termitomyces sp. T159_Od127]